ncbi:MAG: metallophosphoesterase [Butyrivibrio sp.]|nr:metallophosphoesterase [Butyrivibrio sp.]
MWFIIFGVSLLAGIIGVIYLVKMVSRFSLISQIGKRWQRNLVSLLIIAILFAFFCFTMGVVNAFVILFHVLMFSVLFGVIGVTVRRLCGGKGGSAALDDRAGDKDVRNFRDGSSFSEGALQEKSFVEAAPNDFLQHDSSYRGEKCQGLAGRRVYWQGWLTIAATVLTLAVGYYQCHNVWRTEYNLTSDKIDGSVRIAMIADSHIGTTFDGEGFAKEMDKIAADDPDILLIAGDYVDYMTTKADMVRASEALGAMNLKYGVWYAHGNHDEDSFGRDFEASDLEAELEKNGVHVLKDEYEYAGDLCIVGRKSGARGGRSGDSSDDQNGESLRNQEGGSREGQEIGSSRDQNSDLPGGRSNIADLLKGVDDSKYIVVLSHEPIDYENECNTSADLVVSGHTHGGQLIPITYVGVWSGINDRTYGYERRNNTDFIVTSGISDWAIDFKTGTRSEYVIINVNGEN